MRALLFLVAVIMSWAMIASTGVVRNVFVKAGKRSLAIYLLPSAYCPLTLLVTQCLDRIKPRCTSRWKIAEHDPHAGRKQERQHDDREIGGERYLQ